MGRGESDTLNIGVLDMQPIDPPVGGGRIRLLGLYHNLGEKLPTTYLGTYDWPGPEYRKHRLSPNLLEIDVPLSEAHFKVVESWNKLAGDKNVIDTAFALLAELSSDYVQAARELVR